MYDASVNGAPAKPISGIGGLSWARAMVIAWSTKGSDSAGSTSRKRSTSSSVRMGLCSTGPSPALNANCMPIGSRSSRISAKIIAASTPRRSTAMTVTSAASSGVLQSSKKATFARSWRYSGIYRPAWRMSHTGVYGVGSRRQARSRGALCSAAQSLAVWRVIVALCDVSDMPEAFHEGSDGSLCRLGGSPKDAATVQEPESTVKLGAWCNSRGQSSGATQNQVGLDVLYRVGHYGGSVDSSEGQSCQRISLCPTLSIAARPGL